MLKDIAIKVGSLVLVALALAVFVLWTTLGVTQRELEVQRRLAEEQARIIEAVDVIERAETRVETITREVVRTIEEAPNAETPVAPDVAAAWADAIDRLRNDESKPNGEHAYLSGLDPTAAFGKWADGGFPGYVLGAAGSSLSKMQRSSGDGSEIVREQIEWL